MSGPLTHEYGEPDYEYIASWFEREDDGPFWALNLMKYRERALGKDGREQDRSGLEADNEYAPVEQIEAGCRSSRCRRAWTSGRSTSRGRHRHDGTRSGRQGREHRHRPVRGGGQATSSGTSASGRRPAGIGSAPRWPKR